MKLKYGVLIVPALLALASVAQAAVTNVQSVQVPQVGMGVIAGTVTNDILLDFDGALRGQQMILTLTSGSIFQDGFGSNTAPVTNFTILVPTLVNDTFVTVGGVTAETSAPVLVVGGAADLQAGAVLKFDTQGLNIAWAPAPGTNILGGTGFVTSRITLSDDAVGSLQYFGSTSAISGDPLQVEGTVVNGVISFGSVVEAPVVADFNAVALLNETVATTITATNNPDSWSGLLNPTFTPSFGGSNTGNAPQWDPNTQSFSWDTTGWSRGLYTWNVEATNAGGTGSGLISIEVSQVPEPASFVLFGLALAGLAVARRQ